MTGADHPIAARASARGAVLLEVVLALTLFVAGGAVVGAGLNQSLEAARRLRLSGRAADLAVTLLSEIQLGVVEAATVDATAYDDERLADWTWSVEAEPAEDVPGVTVLEVTVRHEPTGVYQTLVRWVSQADLGANP